MNLNSNQTVIRALKSGDSKAYAALYAAYYRPLCRYCAMYISSDEAEEIVQDLMLKLWEHRDSLQENLSLRAFLYTCAKHRALNVVSRAYVTQAVYEEFRSRKSEERPNEQECFRTELYHAYCEVLHSLPRDQQQAFVMSRYQRLTHQRIADALHVSVQTVNYRIGKALQTFRIRLKDFFPE